MSSYRLWSHVFQCSRTHRKYIQVIAASEMINKSISPSPLQKQQQLQQQQINLQKFVQTDFQINSVDKTAASTVTSSTAGFNSSHKYWCIFSNRIWGRSSSDVFPHRSPINLSFILHLHVSLTDVSWSRSYSYSRWHSEERVTNKRRCVIQMRGYRKKEGWHVCWWFDRRIQEF